MGSFAHVGQCGTSCLRLDCEYPGASKKYDIAYEYKTKSSAPDIHRSTKDDIHMQKGNSQLKRTEFVPEKEEWQSEPQ